MISSKKEIKMSKTAESLVLEIIKLKKSSVSEFFEFSSLFSDDEINERRSCSDFSWSLEYQRNFAFSRAIFDSKF